MRENEACRSSPGRSETAWPRTGQTSNQLRSGQIVHRCSGDERRPYPCRRSRIDTHVGTGGAITRLRWAARGRQTDNGGAETPNPTFRITVFRPTYHDGGSASLPLGECLDVRSRGELRGRPPGKGEMVGGVALWAKAITFATWRANSPTLCLSPQGRDSIVSVTSDGLACRCLGDPRPQGASRVNLGRAMRRFARNARPSQQTNRRYKPFLVQLF